VTKARLFKAVGQLPLAEKISLGLAALALVISCFTLYLQFYRVSESFRVIVLNIELRDPFQLVVRAALINGGDRQIVIVDRFLSSTDPEGVSQLPPFFLEGDEDPILLEPHAVRVIRIQGQLDTMDMIHKWESDSSHGLGREGKKTRIGIGFWIATAEGTVIQNGREIGTLFIAKDRSAWYIEPKDPVVALLEP
jgi:hypothetical protein